MSERKTKITATITYKSGRTEMFSDKLNAKESPYKKFSDKLAQYRELSTVTNIELVKS